MRCAKTVRAHAAGRAAAARTKYRRAPLSSACSCHQPLFADRRAARALHGAVPRGPRARAMREQCASRHIAVRPGSRPRALFAALADHRCCAIAASPRRPGACGARCAVLCRTVGGTPGLPWYFACTERSLRAQPCAHSLLPSRIRTHGRRSTHRCLASCPRRGPYARSCARCVSHRAQDRRGRYGRSLVKRNGRLMASAPRSRCYCAESKTRRTPRSAS